jgi:hypothetical protein
MDVEDATVTGHELHGANRVFELFENLRCQTDSVRARPSGDAVLDPNGGGRVHVSSLRVGGERAVLPLRVEHRSSPRWAMGFRAQRGGREWALGRRSLRLTHARANADPRPHGGCQARDRM